MFALSIRILPYVIFALKKDTSSTNMIITNRKIVGTLIYENTKLKEENKVLSKVA